MVKVVAGYHKHIHGKSLVKNLGINLTFRYHKVEVRIPTELIPAQRCSISKITAKLKYSTLIGISI